MTKVWEERATKQAFSTAVRCGMSQNKQESREVFFPFTYCLRQGVQSGLTGET